MKDATIGFLKIRDASLEACWFTSGQQSALQIAMLHEGLGSLTTWRDLPQKLADVCQAAVFVYSRAGHGNSSECAIPRPIDALDREADEVLPQILETISFKNGLLIGHSDGASIATIYAGRHPDNRVKGLVLIEPHFSIEDKNIKSIGKLSRTVSESALLARLARHHRDPSATFEAWRSMWLNPRFSLNLTNELRSIRIPVLLIKSADDPYSTKLQIELLREHCTAPIDVLVIPGNNHAPHRADEARVLERIRNFAQCCSVDRD